MELQYQTSAFFVCLVVAAQIAACISMQSNESPNTVIRHEGKILSDSRLDNLLNVTRVSIITSRSNLNKAIAILNNGFKRTKAGITTELVNLIKNVVADAAANFSLSKEELESRVNKSKIYEIPTQVIFDFETFSKPKLDEAKALVQALVKGFSNVTNYVSNLINRTNSCVMRDTCVGDLWKAIANSTVEIPKKIYSDTEKAIFAIDQIQTEISADGIYRTTTTERTINAKIEEILDLNNSSLANRKIKFGNFLKKVRKSLKKIYKFIIVVRRVISIYFDGSTTLAPIMITKEILN